MHLGDKQLVVIGDRVLIKPEKPEERTKIGLYLPESVLEKESVQGGRVVSTGPGVPLPVFSESEDEPWKVQRSREGRFIPMQAQIGDYAFYLRKEAVELKFEEQTFIIVPQNAILVLVRDDVPEIHEEELDDDTLI